MFIRNERSIGEFVRFYPVVSILVIIHIVLYTIIDLLALQIGEQIYAWGIGFNPLIAEGEYWRIITPMFLHAGFMHMLFNSFALVLFGPALEQMLGKFKFILAYLLVGVAGNIGTFLLDPNRMEPFLSTPHVGASGAIYGLFGIYIYMAVFRKDLIDPASVQIVMVIFIIGMLMTFLRPGINISAHVFGFIGGFALGPIILTGAQPFSMWRNRRMHKDDSVQFDPNRWYKKQRRKENAKTLIWILLGILVVFGILGRLNIL
ncbi:MAG TPA: rhomboid family intramembrane serine protease [Bacillota bacterium]|nr:rhomboid family intramembrane serine protease [Bacillota bacterium]